MLGDIFYFIGLFLFIFSIYKTSIYSKFIDVKEWVIKFKKVTKKDPIKSEFRSEDEYNLYLGFYGTGYIETLWIICGLLSNSWYVFGCLLIIGTLLKFINEKLPFTIQKAIGFIFNLLKSSTIIFLVINHFHLHIDLLKYFL